MAEQMNRTSIDVPGEAKLIQELPGHVMIVLKKMDIL